MKGKIHTLHIAAIFQRSPAPITSSMRQLWDVPLETPKQTLKTTTGFTSSVECNVDLEVFDRSNMEFWRNPVAICLNKRRRKNLNRQMSSLNWIYHHSLYPANNLFDQEQGVIQ